MENYNMKPKSPSEYSVKIKSFSLNDHKSIESKMTNLKELVRILTESNLRGKPIIKICYEGSLDPQAYVFMIDMHYNNYVNDYSYKLSQIDNTITVYYRPTKIYTTYIFSSEKCANRFWETYIENNSYLLKTLYTLHFKKEYFHNVDKVKNINGMTFKTRYDMYKYLGRNYGVDSKDGWVFGHGFTPLIRKQLYLPFEDPKNEYETCEVFFTHEDTTKIITT